jgi:hypothetical protein
MIRIAILIGKEVVATRAWHSVPHVGDHIEVDSMDGTRRQLLLVKQVIWRRGVESGTTQVDVICQKEKK